MNPFDMFNKAILQRVVKIFQIVFHILRNIRGPWNLGKRDFYVLLSHLSYQSGQTFQNWWQAIKCCSRYLTHYRTMKWGKGVTLTRYLTKWQEHKIRSQYYTDLLIQVHIHESVVRSPLHFLLHLWLTAYLPATKRRTRCTNSLDANVASHFPRHIA